MADVTRTVTYRGQPPWHTALAQFLKEEGVRVEWSPPVVPLKPEPRGLGGDVNEVVVNLVSTGSVVAIAAAVRKFRNFGPRTKGKVEIDGQEVDGDGVIND